jgi:hypothetical protein
MGDNKTKAAYDFPDYLTGDVEIVTPAQEQHNKLQRRAGEIQPGPDVVEGSYGEVAEQQDSTLGVKALGATVVDVARRDVEKIGTAIAAANIDNTEAVVGAAEQAGVDTDEVARELQEKEHERKIKPELFSDGIQPLDRKLVTRGYDGYIGGYDWNLYKEYYKEAQDLMTVPEEQRLGTEIIDEFGEARRPIIDIELLDEEDVKDVQKQVNLRKSGFNKIEEFLLQVGSNSEHDIDGKELAHQVADIALKHDIIRPDDRGKLTTIADLYISETDVRQMQRIDKMANDLTGGRYWHHNHYVDEAAKRVVGLTEFNLLCSGTVMVHSGDYISVTESGGLSRDL